MLWHDAAFILGEISEEMYLKQPARHLVRSRMLIACALKNELSGNMKQALALYKQWDTLRLWEKMPDYVLNDFVKWRVTELTGPLKSI